MSRIWAVNQLDNKTAEIMLYGYIGSDQVKAADFVAELKRLETKYSTIKLRVNSGGGSIFEGLAIFNAIRQSTCTIEAYVDGLAASMASVIILACKKIHMSKVAMLMTHRPNGAAIGNPDQLRSTADMLDDLEKTVCQIYAERTRLSIDQVKAKYMGTSDNWHTAEEALREGLIDSIYDAPKPAAIAPPSTMRNEQDLVNFFTNSFNQQTMKDIVISATVMAALNMTADNADQSTFETALAGVVAKANKADELQQKLTAIETAQAAQKVQDLVNAALTDKKILAGEKETYIDLATSNYESTKKLLDGMKPGMSIESQLTGENTENKAELESLVKMSGRDLYMKGKFKRLKELDINQFKAKYKEYYGSDFTEQ
jgi:ATP-dependent protease ClpP protease subunit